MKTKGKEKNNALEQAKAQLASIHEMVRALEEAKDDDTKREEAVQAIHEDPLEVSVRGDWHSAGDAVEDPVEFQILLAWGGPAVRLIGELNKHRQPESVKIEYQDWGTPWTEYRTTAQEDIILMAYASQFYFGE